MSRNWKKVLDREDIVAKSRFFLLEESPNKKIDLQKLFNNSNSTHLDIGVGKGEFISQKSTLEPWINFFGIEAKQKRVISILKKIDIDKNPNIKIWQHYVNSDFGSRFEKEVFNRIYIHHPDPWPKKRQNKNRLINKKFLCSILSLLKKNGILQIITDNIEYSQVISNLLENEEKIKPLSKEKRVSILDNHIPSYFQKLQMDKGYQPKIFLYEKL